MSDSAPSVEFGGDYKTAQIYSMGFEFAFMSPQEGVYKQATPFVYCKDFLHDAVWALLNKKETSIYSFKYDPEKNLALDLERTALCMRNTKYRSQERIEKMRESCVSFLHEIEDKLGFEPCEIYPVEHKAGPCWLILADKGWQHAPPLLSLFTLLVRVGCFHDPKKKSADDTLELVKKGEVKVSDNPEYAGSRDTSYLKQAEKGVAAIFKHGLGLFHEKQEDNYPPEVATGLLHDGFGIVNFTQGRPKKVVPHWYRDEVWK